MLNRAGLVRFKNAIFSTFHQDGKLSIKQIQKRNLPFFIGWIAVIIWLDCYALPIGEVGKAHSLFKTVPVDAFQYLYAISTAVFICLCNIRKLMPYTKLSAVIAVIGISTEIIFDSTLISIIGLAIAAVCFGHIMASTGFGFFMILNNAEKLYSVSLGIILSKVVLLLKVNSMESIYGVKIFGVMQIAGIIFIFICSWFYAESEDHLSFETWKKLTLKDYSVFFLAFAVLVFNDFLAPTLWRSATEIPELTLTTYHATGVFLGVISTIILQQVLRCNIYYVLNFSFTVLMMGLVLSVVANGSEELFVFSALIFGISYATGFISIYYMLGIIAKKSRNMTFYRVGVLLSAVFYLFAFLFIRILENMNSQSAFVVTAFICVVAILGIFIMTPFFTKVLYSAEWTDDLHRPDVTYVSRLNARLSEFKLSPKEIEVGLLLLDGYTMRQISAILSIAYSTVNTYCTSIYRKMGINSRTELVVMFSEYLSDNYHR